MNNDGNKDLLFGDRAGYVQYYSRSASGSLNYEGKIQAGGASMSLDLQAASPCITDWNEDGLLDIIVGAGIWKTKIPLRLYLNKGTKESYLYDDYEFLFYGSDTISATYPQIEVVDLDGDGVKDLLLQDCFYDSWLGGDTTNLFFFKNEGSNNNPIFSKRDTVKYNETPIKSKLAKLDAKDLNSDGAVDMVVTGTGRDVTIYYNDAKVSKQHSIFQKPNDVQVAINGNEIIIKDNDILKWKLYDLSGRVLNSGNFKDSENNRKIKISKSRGLKILALIKSDRSISKIKLFN